MNQRSRKGPPKTFNTLKEARTALTDLADSLSTHQFTWPAAAIRSYLSGGSKSLDEAFGFAQPTEAKPKPKKKQQQKKPAASSKRK